MNYFLHQETSLPCKFRKVSLASLKLARDLKILFVQSLLILKKTHYNTISLMIQGNFKD